MNTLVAWLMSVMMTLGAAPAERQLDRLHQDPAPTPYPEVRVVSSDITQMWSEEGQPSSAVTEIIIEITARNGAVYLNGHHFPGRFVTLELYNILGSPIRSKIVGTSYAPSGDFESPNYSYYALAKDRSMQLKISAILYQLPADHHVEFVGAQIKSLQYGIDDSTPETRSEWMIEDENLTLSSKTGDVPICNCNQ